MPPSVRLEDRGLAPHRAAEAVQVDVHAALAHHGRLAVVVAIDDLRAPAGLVQVVTGGGRVVALGGDVIDVDVAFEVFHVDRGAVVHKVLVALVHHRGDLLQLLHRVLVGAGRVAAAGVALHGLADVLGHARVVAGVADDLGKVVAGQVLAGELLAEGAVGVADELHGRVTVRGQDAADEVDQFLVEVLGHWWCLLRCPSLRQAAGVHSECWWRLPPGIGVTPLPGRGG